MNIYRIFTDGSCTLNKDRSKDNYGGVGVHFDDVLIKDLSTSHNGINVTNQRMELLACIKGIEQVIKYKYNTNITNHNKWRIDVYTDSMYTINCATKWSSVWILHNWKRVVGSQLKDVCNTDLIKKLYTLSCTYPIKYHHVKSHRTEPNNKSLEWSLWKGNNTADKLAGDAMNKIKIKMSCS